MPVCHLGRSLTVFKRSLAAAIGTGADWRRTIPYSKHPFICPCCRLFSILPFLVSTHPQPLSPWGGLGIKQDEWGRASLWSANLRAPLHPLTSTVSTLRREDPASLLLALFVIPLTSREPSLSCIWGSEKLHFLSCLELRFSLIFLSYLMSPAFLPLRSSEVMRSAWHSSLFSLKFEYELLPLVPSGTGKGWDMCSWSQFRLSFYYFMYIVYLSSPYDWTRMLLKIWIHWQCKRIKK